MGADNAVADFGLGISAELCETLMEVASSEGTGRGTIALNRSLRVLFGQWIIAA